MLLWEAGVAIVDVRVGAFGLLVDFAAEVASQAAISAENVVAPVPTATIRRKRRRPNPLRCHSSNNSPNRSVRFTIATFVEENIRCTDGSKMQ